MKRAQEELQRLDEVETYFSLYGRYRSRAVHNQPDVRKGEAIYVELYHAATGGAANCCNTLVSYIETAAKEDWRAAAWLVERRFEEWNPDMKRLRKLEKQFEELVEQQQAKADAEFNRSSGKANRPNRTIGFGQEKTAG